jgi:serine/threonine protein kinase
VVLPDLIDRRFQLEREVGGGGMGRIWRALDARTGRTVAIKVMATDVPTAVERFHREAVTLASIRHPGIVDYIAHGVVDGKPYLVMEWLEGLDLARRLRDVRIDGFATMPALVPIRRPPSEPPPPDRPRADAEAARRSRDAEEPPRPAVGLPIADVVMMARRLASALGEVHAHGVVHRDLKPENVFLIDGDLTRAKLIDFGVARGVRQTAILTDAGVVVGTPYYMAPEQVRGDTVGPPADVWGLGGVLYEALAGQPPFSASHPLGAMARIVVDEPAPLTSMRSDTPDALAALIHAMLAKDPAARPRSGEPLASGFEHILGEFAEPGDRAASSRETPVPGRYRITGGESRVRSLLFARRSERLWGRDAPLAPLRALVASLGGGLEAMDAHEQSFLVTAGGAASPRDQATRAAQIALALRRAEATLALVVVTGRGSSVQRTPVGEVVDRAARLLDRVPAGAIELDSLTAGLVEGRCTVETSGGAFRLRGMRLREEARTLLGRPSRWVGRRRELTTLMASFDDCLENHTARAVLVVGQPGMGKSRLRHELLRALAERGESPLILHGQGDSVSAGAPFGLLGPALRRELLAGDEPAPAVAAGAPGEAAVTAGAPGEAAVTAAPPAVSLDAAERIRARVAEVAGEDAVPRIAPFLGELCGIRFEATAHPALAAAHSDPMLLGEQVRAAFAAWLAAEAAQRPVLLAIEDLHWGDLPSVNAIDHALRELVDHPLLMLATARPEVHEVFPRLWAGRGVIEIALHALPPRACAELVTDALGERATPQVVEQLVARCEGNAFYLEELIRTVAEGGLERLPDTVIGTVQARLDALDQEERRVLRAASIFGEEFSEDGVRALLGETSGAFDIGEWLGDLERRELVHVEHRGTVRDYRFRHALIRDGAYQMLTEDDRKVGHFLAARWLEETGDRDALVLAGHYERGSDRAAAVRCYRIAVDDALEGNDLAAVIERGERALAAGAGGEVLGEIRCAQAIAAYWRSDYATAVRFGDEALALLPVGGAAWFRAAGAAVVAAARLGDFAGVDRRFDRAASAPCAPGAEAAQLQCL